RIETESKYKQELDGKLREFQSNIQHALKNKTLRIEVIKERKSYEREINEKIRQEARLLLRDRFNYPIFLYEAQKVGITATGETDLKELYPNDKMPRDITESALNLYQSFLDRPRAFLSAGSNR